MKPKSIVISILTCALLITAFVVQAIAVPGNYEPDTGFEIDGNILFDGPDGDFDWWDNGKNPGYPPAVLIADPHSKSATDPDIFKPAGKFDEPENWIVQDGSVGPGQNELTNIFAWAVAPGDVGNTDSWLIMGMERTKKSGTFALDFEFNQDDWTPGAPPFSGGPNRTPGDIAVGFELKGNPTNAQEDLKVLIVQFSGTGVSAPELCDTSDYTGKGNDPGIIVVGTDPCPAYGETGWYYRFLANAAILSGSGLGTATMNAQGEGFAQNSFSVDGETYISYDAQGNQDDFVGEFEFAEAAINLTELGIEPGCPGFGSVHAKSRSSLEVGSDLKDLAGPRSFPVQCFIEGYKYLDIDGDGTRDASEPGLNGWTINLDDGSSTVTANDPDGNPGYYLFENLEDGNYTVSEDCSNQDAGWVQTEPLPTDGCGSGEYNFTINIGNRTEVGNFGNGQPAIDVAKACTAVVEVGGIIDYDFDVTNSGNVNLNNISVKDPIAGLDETISSLSPNGTQHYDNPYPAPTTAQTITNTVTATGDFGASTVFATVSDSADCTTRVVDARISITPDDTNEVGDSHTFTVLVEKNDGTGWVDAQGVVPTITFPGGAPGTVNTSDCDGGTDSNGECDVIINSNVAGVFTAHAAADVSVGGLSLHRETDGTGGNSGNATKTYVDGSLTWLKKDSQGNLLGGATFEVCRTHDRFGTDISDECVTVLDNNPPDLDSDDGEFLLDGLLLGRYTITETDPPTGYQADDFVETIELSLADPDKSATHVWVNVPGQGCTTGWWKNQGLEAYDKSTDELAIAVTNAVADYWYSGTAPAGFDGTHDALFRIAFKLTAAEMTDRGLDPNLTLLGAVELGGGGFNALARQGTSALLNSLSVAYEFSTDQVLQDVHDAFVTGDLGTLIDDYDTANSRDHSFCPTG